MDDYVRKIQGSLEAHKLTISDNDVSTQVSFAVFIPTHGRADIQVTYNYLRANGYQGLIFLVVDDLDSQKDNYVKQYGDEVIIFDKVAWGKKTDRIHNEVELGTVTYARNAIVELARSAGIDYFAMLDDDFNSFSIRYEKDGSLKASRITDMSRMFVFYVEYMHFCNIMTTGFGGAGSYIGGVNSQFSVGITGNVAGAFIFNSSMMAKGNLFRGYVNEDVIFALDHLESGKLIFRILDVMYSTPKRGTNAGGHSDMYGDQETYVQDSIVKIAHPTKVSILSSDDKVASRLGWSKATPKILNESWCKV